MSINIGAGLKPRSMLPTETKGGGLDRRRQPLLLLSRWLARARLVSLRLRLAAQPRLGWRIWLAELELRTCRAALWPRRRVAERSKVLARTSGRHHHSPQPAGSGSGGAEINARGRIQRKIAPVGRGQIQRNAPPVGVNQGRGEGRGQVGEGGDKAAVRVAAKVAARAAVARSDVAPPLTIHRKRPPTRPLASDLARV